MKSLMKKVREFVKNEEGQGLVEYALIIALISLIAIIALQLLGRKVSNVYDNASTVMIGT